MKPERETLLRLAAISLDELPIQKAQWLRYMKLSDSPLGLMIHFNAAKLTDGVSRLILPGANVD
jgi:hypothetical protein